MSKRFVILCIIMLWYLMSLVAFKTPESNFLYFNFNLFWEKMYGIFTYLYILIVVLWFNYRLYQPRHENCLFRENSIKCEFICIHIIYKYYSLNIYIVCIGYWPQQDNIYLDNIVSNKKYESYYHFNIGASLCLQSRVQLAKKKGSAPKMLSTAVFTL